MILLRGGQTDDYCREYNEVLQEKMLNGARYRQERYLTVTARRRSKEEAAVYFRRVGAELEARFAALGSVSDGRQGASERSS